MEKTFIAIILIFFAIVLEASERVEIITKFKDGTSVKTERFLDVLQGSGTLKIPSSEIAPNTDTITVTGDFARANAGDSGYIIMPNSLIIPFIQLVE